MKKNITRAIIDATIDRGLREIYEDPRRSIRKLAELGHKFNNSRFTKNLYDIFQDLLRNDDSPYYIAIEHLLQCTSRKNLKHFGINVGYNSFTIGGKMIRSLDEKKQIHAPWMLTIRLDPENKTGISPSDLIPFIAECRKYGVYSYAIRLENNCSYFEDLLKVFITYDDCAFFFILPDQELDENDMSLVSSASNAAYFLPAFGDSCGANFRFLKKHKVWTGLYTYYDDEDAEKESDADSAWDYIPQESSFLLFIAKDGTSAKSMENVSQRIKQMRLSPVVPLFIFDLFGDLMQIQRLISGKEYYYEVLPNGAIHTNTDDIESSGLPDPGKLFAAKASSNGKN